MNKYSLACGILILFLVLAGCMPATENKESAGYEVIDGVGRTIHLQSAPQRIYAMTTNLEDLTLALAGPQRMVAVSEDAVEIDSLCREEALQVGEVVPSELSAEKILTLKPDLIIMQERESDMTTTLENLGLTVYVLPVATNRAMVEKRIEGVAEVLGEREKGERLLADFHAKLQRIEERIAEIPYDERPIGIAYSVQGAFGSAEGLMHSIFNEAGLRNGAAMAGLKRNDHLTKEAIISIRPDYFILPIISSVAKTEGSADELEAEVRHDPAYADLPVIKNNHILRIPDKYRYCNSHRYADAVVYLHEAVYGSLQ